ncbi:HD domain-containing protein [Patescibacteria group bacterium]|nr:HD domain-containing protein [Patescibacteria group bacterium]
MFNIFVSPEDGFEIEKAISFFVSEYAKTGNNPKPVILHTLRVAFSLLEAGYPKDIVIPAILHDVLEDTGVTEEQLEAAFGSRVLQLVKAVSYDESISDEMKKYQDMYTRTLAAGREAVVIKAADLQINSIYVKLVPDKKKQEFLINKEKYFLDLTKEYSDEPAWKSLRVRYEAEVARFETEK